MAIDDAVLGQSYPHKLLDYGKTDVAKQVFFILHSYKCDFINGFPFDIIPSKTWLHTPSILSFREDMLKVKSIEGFLLLSCHDTHV